MNLTPEQRKKITKWYQDYLASLDYPIYSSYDIRKWGNKMAVVDANIFPAGFNNIHQDDQSKVADSLDHYLKLHFQKHDRILLVTEEHTENKFYWDNIMYIKKALEKIGRRVLVAFPRLDQEVLTIHSFSQGILEVFPANPNHPVIKEFDPHLIISNNDFSLELKEWSNYWSIPIVPPRELGWFQRKKSNYFKIYNQLVIEVADILSMDPFWFRIHTRVIENFFIDSEDSQKLLAQQVDQMLEELKDKYEQMAVDFSPTIFIKNNSGTYGLAVTNVNSGYEVLEWGYKQRKKLKAAKGGRKVTEMIIQEGIPTEFTHSGFTAEPVFYMVGCQWVGSFLRYHSHKKIKESLNAPGSYYFSIPKSHFNDTLIGVLGYVGLVALGLEAQMMNVHFKDFERKSCQ